MVNIPLLLMGCGGVGRQLLHHIVSCRPLHSKQGVMLRVVGVCDSKSMVAVPDVLTSHLDDEFLLKLCKVKSSGCQVFSGQEIARKVMEFAATLRKLSGLALVDCSASSQTVELLSQAVNLDCCVVLANKKPLTSSLVTESFSGLQHLCYFFAAMDDYDKLVSQPRRIRHESTVGAGLPVISSINRILSSGDLIFRIIGSLSGTLGYVMSEVEGGRPFSVVVNTAKRLGYTEPDYFGHDPLLSTRLYELRIVVNKDRGEVFTSNSELRGLMPYLLSDPRDDLSGMDVARKALILARLLGRRINLDSIKVESLYPLEMGPDVMPVDEFLSNGLPLLDKDIQNRIVNASSKGKVLRYVVLIEDSRCEVGIQEVAKDSALGRLKGSDNVLTEIMGIGIAKCCRMMIHRKALKILFPSTKSLGMTPRFDLPPGLSISDFSKSWRYIAAAIVNNHWLFKVLEQAMMLRLQESLPTSLIYRTFSDTELSGLVSRTQKARLLGTSPLELPNENPTEQVMWSTFISYSIWRVLARPLTS
ncbi:UNVERIFIED_CONTAM: Bifunctional aspartokinase/homoserine dehydrogenase 1 [Sesamum radiatum]|uniref:homoserine dehydrogenase n=1 Tax=Sesamum radiatum TaxID=300843 RepID=A0AAW2W6A9_SESRA